MYLRECACKEAASLFGVQAAGLSSCTDSHPTRSACHAPPSLPNSAAGSPGKSGPRKARQAAKRWPKGHKLPSAIAGVDVGHVSRCCLLISSTCDRASVRSGGDGATASQRHACASRPEKSLITNPPTHPPCPLICRWWRRTVRWMDAVCACSTTKDMMLSSARQGSQGGEGRLAWLGIALARPGGRQLRRLQHPPGCSWHAVLQLYTT